jgi:hypothetical protein
MNIETISEIKLKGRAINDILNGKHGTPSVVLVGGHSLLLLPTSCHLRRLITPWPERNRTHQINKNSILSQTIRHLKRRHCKNSNHK